MAEKLYYSMGEVTEILDVAPSLVRYWGTQFEALRPHRNKKGNRMFTPEDLDTLKLIYHLVKEQGMTIAGAKKALRARRATASSAELSREVALLDKLQQIRALLVEVRDGLGADIVEVDVEAAVKSVPAEPAAKPKVKRVKRPKESLNPPVEERPLFPFYEQTLF